MPVLCLFFRKFFSQPVSDCDPFDRFQMVRRGYLVSVGLPKTCERRSKAFSFFKPSNRVHARIEACFWMASSVRMNTIADSPLTARTNQGRDRHVLVSEAPLPPSELAINSFNRHWMFVSRAKPYPQI
jgi:hypothetical protein